MACSFSNKIRKATTATSMREPTETKTMRELVVQN
jgi:hypothetical protein